MLMMLLEMALHKVLVQLEGYANHLVNVQVFTFIIFTVTIITLTNIAILSKYVHLFLF